MSVQVVLVSASSDGHRASYIALFSKLWRTVVRPPHWRLAFGKAPVFFLMIEENFGIYCLVSVLRSLFGKRTAGLLFRPGPALSAATWRTACKSILLRCCRRLPLTSTLTILPFDLQPGFARIADGWIYDPQMWDLSDEQIDQHGNAEKAGMQALIQQAAGNRSVVSTIGRQDLHKGFDLFALGFVGSTPLREAAIFVSAGKVDPTIVAEAKALGDMGGLVVDRFVTDPEMLEVYAGSDLIWCAYAQDYDQASGIFGRAVQLGVPAVVRRGSLLHRQCLRDDLPHVAISGAEIAGPIIAFLASPPAAAVVQPAEWRRQSIAKLTAALGIVP